MTPSSWILDVGDADFEREVLKRSETTPVVVDFWAPWCAPCRTLAPVLERLADEHRGAFVLAKLNVDEAPAVAQAFGIRSIPAVKAFRGGRVAGEFVGAQPESVVRKLLESVLPTEADALADEGEAFAASGHGNAAEERFRAALAREARHARALLGLARLLGERAAAEEALALLARIPPDTPQEREGERLAAALRTQEAAGAQDEGALRARLAAHPGDLAARLALGRTLAAAGRHEEALAELLDAVRRDAHFEDDAARRAMLDLFALLGPEHPLTERYRGELARALYR